MRLRLTPSRLPSPLGDILLFAFTMGGVLLSWRLTNDAVTCAAWAGAVGAAVGLGWWDNHRRDRRLRADATLRTPAS